MADQDDERITAPAWGFLGFITFINVLNFVDRQLLGSFANFIVPDLGLSNTQFGLLTGFAFIIFYAAMGLVTGALADVMHRPRLIAAGIALWSVLTAASGAARGFVGLAIPRMLIGVGESVLTPTSMSLLSDRFPAARLGFAAGFYYMGVPIGAGISLLIAGYLGPAIGWRNCFYALGALGVVVSIAMLFMREVPRRHVAVPANGVAPQTRPQLTVIVRTLAGALMRSPALVLTIAGGVTMHFVLGAATFDQLWYVQERGFDRAFIAQATGWIGMAGGVLGNLVGGAGSDWFMRRTGQGRAMFLFWIMVAMAPLGLAYRLVPPDSIWFWIGIFGGFFQLGSFYGPTFSTVQELVPPQIRATVVAFYILTLNVIGLGVGITFAGFAIDWMIDAGIDMPYSKALVGFTLLSMLSIPLFYLAGRRYAGDRERLLALSAA